MLQHAAIQAGDVRARPRTGMDQGVAMEIDDIDPRNIENDGVAVGGLAEPLQG